VAGNGRSALSRLIAQKIYQPSEVIVSEPQQQRRMEQQYGVQVTADNRVVALETSVILLAVKPQLFEVIAAELADVVATPAVESLPLVISILAGVPLLEAVFLNCPSSGQCLIPGNGGITAISSGSHTRKATKTQRRNCSLRWRSRRSTRNADGCGDVRLVGPAYEAIMVEALMEAWQRL